LLYDHHVDLVAESQDVKVLLDEKTEQKVTVPEEISSRIKTLKAIKTKIPN